MDAAGLLSADHAFDFIFMVRRGDTIHLRREGNGAEDCGLVHNDVRKQCAEGGVALLPCGEGRNGPQVTVWVQVTGKCRWEVSRPVRSGSVPCYDLSLLHGGDGGRWGCRWVQGRG